MENKELMITNGTAADLIAPLRQQILFTDEQEFKIAKLLKRSRGKLTTQQGAMTAEAVNGIIQLIELCGDDSTRDGLHDSPFRFIKAMLEYTEGYREDPKKHLEKSFEVDTEELVLVKDIEFNSLCEHHFAPFYGKAHVAYIPNSTGGTITGLSKIARMVDGYAKRFQVQERLTKEIADAMETVLQPRGVMVVIEAKHMCMCGRGVQKRTSSTATSAVRGLFRDSQAARNEFLQLVKG